MDSPSKFTDKNDKDIKIAWIQHRGVWVTAAFAVAAAASGPVIGAIKNSEESSPKPQATVTVTESVTQTPRSPSNATPRARPYVSPSSRGKSLLSMSPIEQRGSFGEGTKTVNLKRYSGSIYFDGESSLAYQVSRKYRKFSALIGFSDSSASDCDMYFTMAVDGNEKPDIQPTIGSDPIPVDVDISDAFRLTIGSREVSLGCNMVLINPRLLQ
jgi:NPCBM/NEW2 domain